MSWFKKKSVDRQVVADPDTSLTRIEIEPHKDAQAQAFKDAKKVNEKLNTLLVENGFTLKIWVAAGGQSHNGGSH